MCIQPPDSKPFMQSSSTHCVWSGIKFLSLMVTHTSRRKWPDDNGIPCMLRNTPLDGKATDHPKTPLEERNFLSGLGVVVFFWGRMS